MSPRIGSLFTGYGGFDMAVQEVLGGSLAWVADPAPGPSKLLAYRHPDVPNLGDITAVDWAAAEPVDIIAGGSPCFVADTPVLTRRGLIPIKDVCVGDEVWTHRARWRPVTATMTRTAPTVEFRPGFYSTPDHRLWLRKQGRKWNNDRRAYGRVLGGPAWIAAEHSQGHYAATPINVTDVDHDKPETLTWWQIGRFLADGYTDRQVHVYIGGPKLADAERFPGWKHIQQETALRLTMPRSATEANWLSLHFGKGAHGKTLPAFVLALPTEDRREVLDGYWSGDGHAFAKRSKRSVSVSPGLTVGIQILAASLGYSVSLHYNRTAPTTVIQGRTVSQRDWWSVTATPDEGRYTERDGDWLWQKLRKEPAEGPLQRVYDLTVVDDHSFVAAGIVVHNCQDLSTAGRRAGMTEGTRSNLWVAMREAIAHVRPKLVVWENVRGALSASASSAVESEPGLLGDRGGRPALRALGRVVGDLADLGYVGRWVGLRVADLGGCHGRCRIFLVAWPADADGSGLREIQSHLRARESDATGGLAPDADRIRIDRPGLPRDGGLGSPDSGSTADPLSLLPTPVASNPNDGESPETWLARRERGRRSARNGNGRGMPLSIAVQLLPTPTTTQRGPDANLDTREGARANLHNALLLPTPSAADAAGVAKTRRLGRFGDYALAVASHERLVGRPAPDPTELHNGKPRLSARFVEWMMCLPDGWVTDVPCVARTEQLALLGNGVIPLQAAAALLHLLGD